MEDLNYTLNALANDNGTWLMLAAAVAVGALFVGIVMYDSSRRSRRYRRSQSRGHENQPGPWRLFSVSHRLRRVRKLAGDIDSEVSRYQQHNQRKWPRGKTTRTS